MQFRTFASEAFDPQKKDSLPVRRRPNSARSEHSGEEDSAYGIRQTFILHTAAC
jgi:hypothetical protein